MSATEEERKYFLNYDAIYNIRESLLTTLTDYANDMEINDDISIIRTLTSIEFKDNPNVIKSKYYHIYVIIKIFTILGINMKQTAMIINFYIIRM